MKNYEGEKPEMPQGAEMPQGVTTEMPQGAGATQKPVATQKGNSSPQKKGFNLTAIQFLKFAVFSLGAGLIQLVSFSLLNELTPLTYWISYLIALVLSVLYNFTLNRKFTFKSAANVPRAMLLALLFYVPFAPYSSWLTDFLTVQKLWNEYLVLVLVMAQNMVLEFLWCKFVVFRNNLNTALRAEKTE